jgi:D-alanyl-D-alanine carboxypeptidase (penicillin-binding protein 5/6)
MQFLICFLLLTIAAVGQAEPAIRATAAVLINGKTGEVLWSKDPHRVMFPASTTKIMTTILLLENAALNETVTTSRLASATRGSSLYLAPGQEIQVSDLLYGLMLQSANDGSVAAAEHIAGSVEAFAAMMNMKARQLGARNTNFTNPHGLPDEEHVTTAYDLAMITQYAVKNPGFRKLISATRHTISWLGEEPRLLTNRIPLMKSYEGMIGGKMGYTLAAKRTFVGIAERDGMELIAVVLQASGDQLWDDTVTLLDYGFNTFSLMVPVKEGEIMGSVPLRFGEPVFLQAIKSYEVIRPTAEAENVSVELRVMDKISAPVAKGEVLGEALITVDGNALGSVPLVAADDVQRAVLATGRFWIGLFLFILAGLRVRKLVRVSMRKKIKLKRRKCRRVARKFR